VVSKRKTFAFSAGGQRLAVLAACSTGIWCLMAYCLIHDVGRFDLDTGSHSRRDERFYLIHVD
jgi:hypothetical protein